MEYYLTLAAIIIVLIVVVMILFIFMPTPTCFYDHEDLQCINFLNFTKEDNYNKLVEETQKIKSATVFWQNNKLSEEMFSYPFLHKLLMTLPNVRKVFVYDVPKKLKEDEKRIGSEPHANHTLRCILPIKISGCEKSGIWVDGKTKFFQKNQWVIYDDSKEHSFFNKHRRKPTKLLVVDIQRPSHIPIGISQVSHDKLI